MQDTSLSLTGDGSHSVFSDKFQALYHSKHGAIQESLHVFIEAGLKHCKKANPCVLEMGFGTGLNALLSMLYCDKIDTHIHYETIEAYPLTIDQIEQLNYLEELKVSEARQTDFKFLHQSEWNKIHHLKNFDFRKHLIRIEEIDLDHKFDVVFYDAFAPLTQEELWTPEIFQKLSIFLNSDAILVSYCAKGSFKRALISAGFAIEKIPGPPGKREMIRATYKP